MTVLRPKSVSEAVALLDEHPQAVPLAGGTDFMVGWNLGLLNNKTILDLSGLKEWEKITASGKHVSLGSMVTHLQAYTHPAVLKNIPLLAQACMTVGAVAIQNRGTLGGNLANASPAGDTFPALLVYAASVRTTRRLIPVQQFFAGVKKNVLESGELITSIEVPIPAKPTKSLYRKVGTRQAQAISKTVAAGLLWLDKGVVKELRFAFGSMAPTAKRLTAAENHVKGKKLTPALADEACALIEKDVSPIDDIRSTRNYRLAVSKNILRSFLLS
jgi:CO/xanthine dehydrogenase FAD-binding subunit